MGGAVAAYSSWGKFKSVAQVLMDMDRKQKELLYKSAMSILQNAAVSDVMALNAVVAGDMVLRKALLDKVVDHVKDQLHMELNE